MGVGVGLGGINITFAPQVVVQGGGDAASQLEQAMGDIEDQFEVWFERFMARNRGGWRMATYNGWTWDDYDPVQGGTRRYLGRYRLCRPTATAR